ncbi:MAG: N-acetylmuramic acid 6-phosphate etherase [Rhizobiaceae bacterium]
MSQTATDKPTTEALNDCAIGLDSRKPAQILGALLDGQTAAAAAVSGAIDAIARAADVAAKAVAGGNTLAYVGAGSSGLMAMADALELPGTFGIPAEQIKVVLAGGNSSLSDLIGAHDDDEKGAESDIAKANFSSGDCAICVSASGTTPYTVKAAQILQQRGITTIVLANNRGSLLLNGADIPVLLATPPELISGSTRMGAGTAQKIALNMFSTLMAVHLGHVHDGMMINLTADNEKLRRRACGMVAAIAGCSAEQAADYLDRAGGSVKVAVLLAGGIADSSAAEAMLATSGGNLRGALAAI